MKYMASMKQPTIASSAPAEFAGDRGVATRQKLLTAAIDVFGQYGFDGTTTRALAAAAGVNLQAIPYYFGGKDGLYLAAAEHLAALITSHVGSQRQQVHDRLAEIQRDGRPVTQEEARALLTALLNTLAEVMVSERSRAWARFLIREQMAPTEAFSKIYEAVMRPIVETVRRLVGILLDLPPASEQAGLRALSLIGSVMVFRVANATVLRQLDWSEMGPQELDAIRANVSDIVRALQGGGAK